MTTWAELFDRTEPIAVEIESIRETLDRQRTDGTEDGDA